MADLSRTFHSFAVLGAGLATILTLFFASPAQAEVLEEATAATTGAAEAAEAAPTELPPALAAEPEVETSVEVTAAEVESAAPEPVSASTEAVRTVAEPVAKTVEPAAARVEAPVSKTVSTVSATVESTSPAPVAKKFEEKVVEGVGGRLGRLKDASAAPSVPQPQVAPSTGSTAATPFAEPNVAMPPAASGVLPEPRGLPAVLGAFASHSAPLTRGLSGAAGSLPSISSLAPAAADAGPVRAPVGGGRGSAPAHAPGPPPGVPAAVGSTSAGTSFVPIAALLALLALVAPAIFRRPLRVPRSRAPVELACALERPG